VFASPAGAKAEKRGRKKGESCEMIPEVVQT